MTSFWPNCSQLQEVPGKGRGLIATKPIPAGSKLFTETALYTRPFRLPPTRDLPAGAIEDIVDQLLKHPSEHAKNLFYPPSNTPAPTDRERARLQVRYNGVMTNAPPTTGHNPPLPFPMFRLVLPLIGVHLNHSCYPNATLYPHPDGITFTCFALRDIAEGEEVCHSYLPELLCWPLEKRRAHLKTSHEFICECERCLGLVHSDEEVRLEMEEGDAGYEEVVGRFAVFESVMGGDGSPISMPKALASIQNFMNTPDLPPNNWRRLPVLEAYIEVMSIFEKVRDLHSRPGPYVQKD
ncbi:hypothetical protein HDV00_006547 [Rhizophlyctis rosea]|nr:hypothetical protein HDV00_006547 [Rhizophlyctis rosea]